MDRYLGIDVGAETLKVVELLGEGAALRTGRRWRVAHGKAPGARLVSLLGEVGWDGVAGAAVTGRLGRLVALPWLPAAHALAAGHRHLRGGEPVTLVSIGSRGFSVVEAHEGGRTVVRENARCAQGTGNFLRQLVERLGLEVEEACRLAEHADRAAPLSGRCPVILKTDLTHLANQGERRERILAGLLDAIAENVEALVKPAGAPPRVALCGGVALAARVRAHLRAFLDRQGMALQGGDPEEALHLEATGAALHAAEHPAEPPPLARLLAPPTADALETLPAPAAALARVRRMPAAAPAPPGGAVVLGVDVGSTGAKAVALDLARAAPVWEGYRATGGDPVGAAQALVRAFLAGPAGASPVVGFGATGSGRDIVGSLLATCFGPEPVVVLNEIAAHAAGAVHHDARVDTIFEIGGQDAKYIRLEAGQVVDAAMNEACSAGTGSFIEEQGRRFEGAPGVEALAALARGADGAAALGQHCSIFMAEVIDEAVAAGVPRDRIVAGLYESVVANYLNRVKGGRPVGRVVFCQGMPFAADALAAAVARRTGAEVIVPPSPGTVGALGIALLAARELSPAGWPALALERFLEACVERRDTFVCGAAQGCGGAGNRCRIDRLTTTVAGARQRFSWGGACALWDRGTRRGHLPDRSPDPFREREALVDALVAALAGPAPGRRVALTDGFQLKGLFPFFATFLRRLGLALEVVRCPGREALQRGARAAQVAFCAPMQQHHGVAATLAERGTDLVFLPMLRELPRVDGERASQLCPVVQGAPDVLSADLGAALAGRLLSPVIDVGPGQLDAPAFLDSCRRLAGALGVRDGRAVQDAWQAGRAAQAEFDAALGALGDRALQRCAADGLLAVVVLGRTYTIHDEILSANVPALLREQGALAIPLDCYPVDRAAPVFPSMYWGHGQRILRAAWQVRRTPGAYALFASNTACGPDSFTLHFFGALMEGKPFAVIETDGHAGDAGTRTRIEAFLHCARSHRRAEAAADGPAGAYAPGAGAAEARDRLTVSSRTLPELLRSGERLLVPSMGPQADVIAAVLRGLGLDAELLPPPTRETLALGRRHTSGKECLPAVVTLGALLERLARERDPAARFAFLMPGTDGPCRFGAYKELHQLVLARLGLGARVRIWAPPFGDYFQGAPPGAGALVLAGATAVDVLRDLRYEVAPVERRPGVAGALFERFHRQLLRLLEAEARGALTAGAVLREAATGHLHGVPALLRRAAAAFRAARGPGAPPAVLVVGEIYLRNEPFSSGFTADALARRGIVARVAGATEFLQYSDHCGRGRRAPGLAGRLDGWVRRRIEEVCHAAAAGAMGWGPAARVPETLAHAAGYLREALEGEAVLTVGASLGAWRRTEVDAVLSVGPLDCMPNKLAESLLHHAARREGLLSLTLSLNGDPVDPEVLDAFAFEVHARARNARASARSGASGSASLQAASSRSSAAAAPARSPSRESASARRSRARGQAQLRHSWRQT
jgi:activator of 2-hydroxyglutaryl-CoA dehydratase/predicted nucleotide-binding protein (sugar kinase/HSP70/actin superfamily)